MSESRKTFKGDKQTQASDDVTQTMIHFYKGWSIERIHIL